MPFHSGFRFAINSLHAFLPFLFKLLTDRSFLDKSEWISLARSNLDLRNLLFHLVPDASVSIPFAEKDFPAPRFQFLRNVTKLFRERIARKWGGREGKRGIRMQTATPR